MIPEQIVLVQESYELLAPRAEAVAQRFYRRLFRLDPGLRRIFPRRMGLQRSKFLLMLNTAVNGLWDLDALAPVLLQLGARHVAYGVQPADYDVVATAVMRTLRRELAQAFTAEVEEAWRTAYAAMAAIMRRGAA